MHVEELALKNKILTFEELWKIAYLKAEELKLKKYLKEFKNTSNNKISALYDFKDNKILINYNKIVNEYNDFYNYYSKIYNIKDKNISFKNSYINIELLDTIIHELIHALQYKEYINYEIDENVKLSLIYWSKYYDALKNLKDTFLHEYDAIVRASMNYLDIFNKSKIIDKELLYIINYITARRILKYYTYDNNTTYPINKMVKKLKIDNIKNRDFDTNDLVNLRQGNNLHLSSFLTLNNIKNGKIRTRNLYNNLSSF